MPWILAPGEGPENWGEPGHWPLWLGDTMAYGELGSSAPPLLQGRVTNYQSLNNAQCIQP